MSRKKKINPLNAITKYFKEVKAELKKVVWPTFKQIKNNTIIVLISLVIVGAIIWVFDLGFAKTLGRVVEKTPVPQGDIITDEDMYPMDEFDMEGLDIEGLDMEEPNGDDMDLENLLPDDEDLGSEDEQ